MGFDSFWNGTPPKTTQTGYTPWIKDPGYDFSSALYSYMMGMIGKPAPSYRGPSASSIANKLPSMAPEMRNLMALGRRYMDTGMPTVFGTGISSLGRFLAPSFSNPTARLQMGGMGGGMPGGMGGGGFPRYMGSGMDPMAMLRLQQQPPAAQGPPMMGGQPPQQAPADFNFFRQYGG